MTQTHNKFTLIFLEMKYNLEYMGMPLSKYVSVSMGWGLIGWGGHKLTHKHLI